MPLLQARVIATDGVSAARFHSPRRVGPLRFSIACRWHSRKPARALRRVESEASLHGLAAPLLKALPSVSQPRLCNPLLPNGAVPKAAEHALAVPPRLILTLANGVGDHFSAGGALAPPCRRCCLSNRLRPWRLCLRSRATVDVAAVEVAAACGEATYEPARHLRRGGGPDVCGQ